MPMKVIRVALDVPVAKLFDYFAPDATAADVGQRVLVPFGRKQAIGIIVELAHSSELSGDRLKSAIRILRESPPLAADDLHLMRFAADYYHHPLGAVVMGALPARLRRAAEPSRRRKPGGKDGDTAGALPRAAASPPELTAAQAQAVAEIRRGLGAFHPFLLLGVTGSGKTEVYL